jgi:hypothetical protein
MDSEVDVENQCRTTTRDARHMPDILRATETAWDNISRFFHRIAYRISTSSHTRQTLTGNLGHSTSIDSIAEEAISGREADDNNLGHCDSILERSSSSEVKLHFSGPSVSLQSIAPALPVHAPLFDLSYNICMVSFRFEGILKAFFDAFLQLGV